MKERINDFSTYALVTGAASGMGRIYATRLAGLGYSLILVDIDETRLDATVESIRTEVDEPSLRIMKIVQDLSAGNAAEMVHGATEEGGCQVEVLINNAGIMYCQGIAETSEKMLDRIMMLHMYTPLMLCRKYVGAMKERGKGYILNVSSIAAWMTWPGIGMYGITKRFVRHYSRELRIECQKSGVSVTNAYFGAVDTPLVPLKDSLRKVARRTGVMMSPEKAARKALKATFRRRKGITPGLMNKIFVPLIIIVPDCLLGWIYRKAKPYLMKV